MQSSNYPFISCHPNKIRRRVGARVCAECSGTESRVWRVGENGETLCNKCGLRNRRTRTKAQPASRSSPDVNPVLSLGSLSPTNFQSTLPAAGASDLAAHDYPTGDLCDSATSPFDLQVQELISQLNLDPGQIDFDEQFQDHHFAELIRVTDDSDAESPLHMVFPSPTEAFISYDDPGYLETMDFGMAVFQPETEPDDLASSSQDHGPQGADERFSGAQHQTLRTWSFLNQLFGASETSQLEPCLTAATESSFPGPVPGNNYHSNNASGAVMRKYVRCSETPPNTPPFRFVAEWLGSQVSAWPPNVDTSHPITCKCLSCLRNLFIRHNISVPDNPTQNPERWLSSFYNRAAAVHLAALRQGSSMYAAAEMFVCESAGDSFIFTVFAILRAEYVTMPSPSFNSSSVTPHEAARSDLVFDCVVTGVATHSILDDWLHGQLLIEHLNSERAKSAMWDLSRVPTGSHLPDSETFRWLQRILMTGTSGQNTPNVQSGSPQHQLRMFHRIQAVVKYITTPERVEGFRKLEPIMLDVCVRACQEWLIAVLDEASKRPSLESQLEFLAANKEYTADNVAILIHAFWKMNIYRARHICSPKCASHIQPTFDTVMGDAQDVLQKLFAPSSVLPYVRGVAFGYPTQEQLFLTRILGTVFFKIYYSHALFSHEQRVQHAILTRLALVKARVKLIERSGSKLIWNYLPVEIARVASEKLDLALQKLSSVLFNYDCQ